MSVMMIKHKGKMVPAKKVGKKWVPDPGATLAVTKDGLEVKGSQKPAPAPEPKGK